MANSHDLGNLAEDFVANKYIKKDYKILIRNYRFKKAEVDLIAFKNNTLIIIEVKARTYNTVARPEESVNRKKKKLLVEAANAYIEQNNLDVEVRFDIVSVLWQNNQWKPNFIVDAFKAHEV